MNKNWTRLIWWVTLFMLFSISTSAQPPEPPPPPGGHGQNGNAPAGAPIDGGLGILLAMGAAYGGNRLWKRYKSSGQ